MDKILGLDMGTDSLGWAVVEQDSTGTCTLKEHGVRIFPQGVKDEKGIESSYAAERTRYRAARRLIRRRRERKIETLRVLVRHELCPYLSEKQLAAWGQHKEYPHSEQFMLWQRTDDNTEKNPYHDRYVCLTRKLDLQQQADRYVLGRALYHISQRRGFLSNRLDNADEQQTGRVKEEIGQLSASMAQAGCTFLGEYFYQLYQKREKIRKHYTARNEHYRAELLAICERQTLPDSWKQELLRAIFFQRPLKFQKGEIGSCAFEKGKARCAVSHPRYEEYRMWCFINNIRIQTPADSAQRPLDAEERAKIIPLFLRKSKPDFDFEDIAKALAGKNRYAYSKEPNEKPYRFNFRMDTSVSGCPITAQLRGFFGDDWVGGLRARYTAGAGKTDERIVNDIWHVIFTFDDKERLKDFAIRKLGLSEPDAGKFAEIRIRRGFASLSLLAISKMLPYLREGIVYSRAVFLANLGRVLPASVWDDPEKRSNVIQAVKATIDGALAAGYKNTRIENEVKSLLADNFELQPGALDRLYHPSKLETFRPGPSIGSIPQLGSPRTDSIRNPMAMRALFQLRHLVNTLLREGKIDSETRIRIELARELNDANKRRAIREHQQTLEKRRRDAAEKIREHYLAAYGTDKTTEDDILRYLLWKEQAEIDLYSGATIPLSGFLGSNPAYDIDHTIPRSRGGNDSQVNKTLCGKRFNEDIKRSKLPAELPGHAETLERIAPWLDRAEDLSRRIEYQRRMAKRASTKEAKDRAISTRHLLEMERNYWQAKIDSFTMTEVPEGFSNRQGVDIGIISKYANLYLKSIFTRTYVVKGLTTSEFRKMWGLQQIDGPKSRTNHSHHCIDAITIACIGKRESDELARLYRASGTSSRMPQVPKPWPTFTEDVKALVQKLLVVHVTPDKLPKQSRRILCLRGSKQPVSEGTKRFEQGDTARGALHKETFYGAILRDDTVRYVVRKSLDSLKESDVKRIVDEVVRAKVEAAIARYGLKRTLSGTDPEATVWMNEEKRIPIRKVRVFADHVTAPLHLKPHRDLSPHKHKQFYHVVNDSNYLMAIYEGTDKGKPKRDFRLLNNLQSASYYKRSNAAQREQQPDIVPLSDDNGNPLRWILKTGTQVLFYEKSPEELYTADYGELQKRLYRITGMSRLIVQKKYAYGSLVLKHHQEARPATDLKAKNGPFVCGEEYRPVITVLHTQLNVLVEGSDFTLTPIGEIVFKNR